MIISSLPGHPFSRAYFKHSRRPFSAAQEQVYCVPRTSSFRAIFQTLEVTIHRQHYIQVSSSQGHHLSCKYFRSTRGDPPPASMSTSLYIPRTSVFVRVFQTLEVTIFGSIITSPFIPTAAVFMRVFQTLEVTDFQQRNKYLRPKDICFRAHISNTRGDHFRAAQEQVQNHIRT